MMRPGETIHCPLCGEGELRRLRKKREPKAKHGGRERKEMPDRNIDDKDQNGWNQGVAYAVAMLIRTFDQPSIALKIWEQSGATLDGVCMYDRLSINREKKRIQESEVKR